MKPSIVASVKSMSSSNSIKPKKSSRDREKRKSSSLSENSLNDKGSPSKDSKQYAGISSDSISIYAEQYMYEHLSEEVCNTLAEDINYKLRYIIHDALLKAKLSGRKMIQASNIEETFKNLSIERVYGAPSNPIWVPFGEQNLLYLDDAKINLIEVAEEENVYAQHGSMVLAKCWYPDPEPTQALKNYFMSMCHAVISNDEEIRQIALKDISVNPLIGPIIEWFYHFGYFLLMKDMKYGYLMAYALSLIETLENSPISSANVSVKQLKLLVRILLQRLLRSVSSEDILKQMCSTLALLCLRDSLKDMVIAKINQKIISTNYDIAIPVLNIIYYLGIDGIKSIFMPNINYFLAAVDDSKPQVRSVILGIYSLISKAEPTDSYTQNLFYEVFQDQLVIFWKPFPHRIEETTKMDMNFVTMKTQLIRTRRKVDVNIYRKRPKIQLEEVFNIPTSNCKVRRLIEEHRKGLKTFKKETHITVGKTTLLLSVLKDSHKNKSFHKKCLDHSLFNYNL